MLDEAQRSDRSDQELIAATATGDRAAFGALVERYQARVFRLARALTRDVQQAEDVLQDTFLSALRGAAGYRGEAPVSAWLYAIARHAAYRLGRRAAEVVSDDASLERLGLDAGWGTNDVEAAAVHAERQAAVTAALARLPIDEREVLALRDIGGLSGEATAAALGITVPAMKSRLHRARLRLAGLLRNPGGDHAAR